LRALALILIWLVLAVPGIAQETPGIYLDHRSFHAGRPDVSLDSVTFDWYFSEEDGYARGTIRGSARQVIEPLVVCFPGACFLLDAGRRDSDVLYFSRLAETGRICLFRLVRMEMAWVPMKAYNPANGRPFLEGRVPRTREVAEWHLWRPEDNAFSQLDRRTYAEWTGFEAEVQLREQDMIKGIRTYNQIMANRHTND